MACSSHWAARRGVALKSTKSMDQRFACCISWGPEWDYHTKWQQRLARIERGEILSLSVPWQHLLWVFGVTTKEDAFKKLEGFKLEA